MASLTQVSTSKRRRIRLSTDFLFTGPQLDRRRHGTVNANTKSPATAKTSQGNVGGSLSGLAGTMGSSTDGACRSRHTCRLS